MAHSDEILRKTGKSLSGSGHRIEKIICLCWACKKIWILPGLLRKPRYLGIPGLLLAEIPNFFSVLGNHLPFKTLKKTLLVYEKFHVHPVIQIKLSPLIYQRVYSKMLQTYFSHQEAVHHPVVQELCDWINGAPDRRIGFAEAISTATSKGVVEMQDIRCLSDWFNFLDSLLSWVPSESIDGTEIFNRFCKLYFVLDQPSIFQYQNPVTPDSANATELSFVSQWIVRFNSTFGTFMDTPESLTPETLATFEASPKFRLSEYLPPRGGWRSFNEFFARHFKPGYRPVAAVGDSSVIVSPVDFTFGEELEISLSSTLTAKGLNGVSAS